MESKVIDPALVCQVKLDRLDKMVEENLDQIRVRTEFSHGDVMRVLDVLHLTSVKLGDYLVVMSATEDTTIGGEPYIALQLWLNMISGKVISRIWGRTVACATVINIDHFTAVCSKHFSAAPCLGCPYQEDELEQSIQGYLISQTPVTRKISLECQKFLADDNKVNIKACQNCLELVPCEWFERETVNSHQKHINIKKELEETQQEIDFIQEHNVLGEVEELNSRTLKVKGLWESTKSPSHSPTLLPHMPVSSTNLLLKENAADDSSKGVFLVKNVARINPGSVTERKSDREIGPLDVECEFCGDIFTCGSFPKHVKKMHGVTSTFKRKCFWCADSVGFHNMKGHAKEHHFLGSFSCKESECNFKENFARDLVSHINCEHEGEVDAECPQCEKGWPVIEIENHYKECLTQHLKTLNSRVINECCGTCGKVFKSGKGLREHKIKHLREQAEKGVAGIDEANLYYHCDKCDKRLVSKQGLLEHLKIHDESSKFPCPTCGLAFARKQTLKEHERAAHSTDENYQCKDCGKRFGNQSQLKKHKLSHEEPQFQCKYCSKKLSTAVYLKNHERYHTGEKPFMCSTCGKGYVSMNQLQQHQTGAHNITGPKGRTPGRKRSKKEDAGTDYHCDKCGNKFVSKEGLRTHQRQFHDESIKFPCPSCDLVFDSKNKLKEHQLVAHSTDKSYQCSDCGKRFGNKAMLKRHNLTHEGPQLQCKHCPKKLSTAYNLKNHERTHTGEKPFMCSICGNGYPSMNQLQQHQAGAHKIAGPQGRRPGWKRSKK